MPITDHRPLIISTKRFTDHDPAVASSIIRRGATLTGQTPQPSRLSRLGLVRLILMISIGGLLLPLRNLWMEFHDELIIANQKSDAWMYLPPPYEQVPGLIATIGNTQRDGGVVSITRQPRMVDLSELFFMEPIDISHDTKRWMNESTRQNGSNSKSIGRVVEPLMEKGCYYCDIEPDIIGNYPEECQPMASWQTTFYPTCNLLHEIDVLSALRALVTLQPYQDEEEGEEEEADDEKDQAKTFSDLLEDTLQLISTAGSWRTVWRWNRRFPPTSLQQSRGSLALPTEVLGIKLLRYTRNFTHQSFQQHQIDAMAMERLTSSPYLVHMHAFCGQSVITEWATGSARLHLKENSFGARQRLKLARDIARALAAVHSIDYPNATNVTLTHNDINIANAIEVEGRIKLNDFNIGNLLRWNVTSQRLCHTPIRFRAPFWKSPEENREQEVWAPPTDVYGLGNLLFQAMTRRQPWTHLEPNGPLNATEVARRKAGGLLPHIPPEYSQSPKIAIQALYYAILACYRWVPEERPTSHQVAIGLEQALAWARIETSVSASQIEELFAVPTYGNHSLL